MIYSNDNYYEAILQLRPYNKRVLNYVKEQINLDKNALISREFKKKYGVDLKLTSKFFAMRIGRKLKSRFGGTIKISRTLYGVHRQTSKRLYRLTVCFRLPEPVRE